MEGIDFEDSDEPKTKKSKLEEDEGPVYTEMTNIRYENSRDSNEGSSPIHSGSENDSQQSVTTSLNQGLEDILDQNTSFKTSMDLSNEIDVTENNESLTDIKYEIDTDFGPPKKEKKKELKSKKELEEEEREKMQ